MIKKGNGAATPLPRNANKIIRLLTCLGFTLFIYISNLRIGSNNKNKGKVMKSLKIFVFAILFISVTSEILAQDFSFTYSGPTTVVVPYGSSTVNATYYFTYYYPEDITLIRPRLTIQFDGTTIAGAICEGNDSYTPSGYTFSLTPGTHTIKLTLSDLGQQSNDCTEATIWQIVQFTVTANFKVRNENTFGGGTIYVDNYKTSKTSPYDRTAYANFSYPIGAIDQDFGGYHWIWNASGINNSKWQKQLYSNPNMSDVSYNRNTTYTVQSNDKDTKLIGGLRKICRPNFQNSFVGGSNSGVIKVNNTQYNSPTAQFDVVELNPISATAVYQAISEIGYTFNHWSDGSTSATKTFNPGSTQTYTAYYTGKPLTTNRALHTGLVYNQPIVLYWNEHPNVNVTQYQIWRKVKHNGLMGDAILIATVNRGTTSYVDDEYNLTRTYSNDLLYYDVKPYYSTEGTYSDNNWFAVYGVLMPKTNDSTSATTVEFENSLANFPNPFNPATSISFSIKEASHVNIKVFDLLGQQIVELVNEEKEAGNYSISFNASHLPSGIYLYTINSKNFTQTRKMLLMK